MLACQTAEAEDKILSFFEKSNDQITINSDDLEARYVPDGYEVTFIDKVRIEQGPLNVKCDRLILHVKDKGAKRTSGALKPSLSAKDISNVRSATAYGNVTVVYKKTMAASEKLLYDGVRRTVTFKGGKPKMWQGPNVIIANVITVYLDENRVDVQGGQDGPISFTMHPGKEGKDKK
jgi:lipopolysaccharide transport protein LptA